MNATRAVRRFLWLGVLGGGWASAAGAPPARPLDPVCRMEVTVDAATLREERNGQTWYFCGEAWAKECRTSPDTYAPAPGR